MRVPTSTISHSIPTQRILKSLQYQEPGGNLRAVAVRLMAKTMTNIEFIIEAMLL